MFSPLNIDCPEMYSDACRPDINKERQLGEDEIVMVGLTIDESS
jgi:hypothetical protein